MQVLSIVRAHHHVPDCLPQLLGYVEHDIVDRILSRRPHCLPQKAELVSRAICKTGFQQQHVGTKYEDSLVNLVQLPRTRHEPATNPIGARAATGVRSFDWPREDKSTMDKRGGDPVSAFRALSFHYY